MVDTVKQFAPGEQADDLTLLIAKSRSQCRPLGVPIGVTTNEARRSYQKPVCSTSYDGPPSPLNSNSRGNGICISWPLSAYAAGRKSFFDN